MSAIFSGYQGVDAEEDNGGRAKRRRKSTNHFEFDSIQNEEQKLFQQALKNSTIDHFKQDLEIREAPTYYPSRIEFKDPLKYIRSISAEAAQYGICKIVPPAEWEPPCQVSMDDPRRFPTKRQEINILQQGKGFDEGKVYNIAEYKAMADAFYDKWMEQHYGEKPAGLAETAAPTGPSLREQCRELDDTATAEAPLDDVDVGTTLPDPIMTTTVGGVQMHRSTHA